MKEVLKKKYLGDIISSDGRRRKQIFRIGQQIYGQHKRDSYYIKRKTIWKALL